MLRKVFGICFWFVVLGLLALSGVEGLSAEAFAADGVSLGEIVVTPLRSESSIGKTAASIEIIDRQAIEESQESTIAGLLRNSAGVVVRDYYGTGTRVAVDLRGFGEFASQNTLVLIDGRRINEIDLTGVDWAQIPLERVQRIEVLRGSGSVAYGDNATGGVVNIITKKGKQNLSGKIAVSGGSCNMHKTNISVSMMESNLGYSLDSAYVTTDGYRDNSDYRAFDFGGDVNYNLADTTKIDLSMHYHEADLGLSGAIRESQFAANTRRDSLFNDDKIGEKNWYANLDLSNDFDGAGVLHLSASFRRRRVTNNLLSSLTYDGRRIDTLSMRPKYTLDSEFFGKNNSIVVGADYYKSDTIIDAYSHAGWPTFYSGAKTRETDIDKESVGYYVIDKIDLFEDLLVTVGYRWEKAKYEFDSAPKTGIWTADPFFNATVVNQDAATLNRAVNAGIVYNVGDICRLSFNYEKGFRTPATDEYYSVWSTPPVNISLKTQKNYTYQLGVNFNSWESASVSFSWFFMNLKNELYYNPATFSNENYSKTRRTAAELSLLWDLNDRLSTNFSYTHTQARFKDGTYNGNQVPLVPTHKISLGINSDITDQIMLSATTNFVGERYFINDQAHSYPRLDSYVTVDAKLSYQLDKMNIFFGANNLFNEQYCEYGAISTVYGERGYYPSPERNFNAGISLEF
ncbi:MAG: TonB-dependent receptor [Candidatus Omnitrophica bacterium]|nr:TonB-dependent receptor [Candidatus Omnitrophota bacterium]